MRNTCRYWLPIFLLGFATVTVSAQSFRVQCPTTTITHPVAATSEPANTDLAGTTPIPVLPSQLTFGYNGAVGLALDVANTVNIYDIAEVGNTVYVQTNAPLGLNAGDSVLIAHTGAGVFPAPGPYD